MGIGMDRLGNATGYVIQKFYEAKSLAEEQYEKYMNKRKTVKLDEEELDDIDVNETIRQLDEKIEEIQKKQVEENVEEKILEKEAEERQSFEEKEAEKQEDVKEEL